MLNRFVACKLLLAVVPFARLCAAPDVISGEINEDATWSGTKVVEGQVIVREGVVLRVGPGTRILMRTGAEMLVRGQLLAEGTESDPIQITRAEPGMTWRRIQFVGASPSRLRHCVVEFANSVGSHLDYYDNDCDAGTPAASRDYHEAVTAVATHLDIENCVFRNLPNEGNGEGDAIALISDDPDQPGEASANIRQCRFLSIGQGIHTRFSHVLVEDCYFTGHNGDNDDVDLYGESTPPPLVRNNFFLDPNHDDMINPTRCSAVIVGNVIAGGDDHGVVLRDKCAPVLMNNLIYNCASAGVAVQNQCDALLVNNTIVNCGRGIRFFDHTGRWGPPYCLFPGSGRATIVNCIVWECGTSLELTDSPFVGDRGSHATVLFSSIEGGPASASVSTRSTLDWGKENLEVDPGFAADYRLTGTSPMIDAGTNILGLLDQWRVSIAPRDRDDVPRPLDGNGDGDAKWDIGASEFLLSSADSNADAIPDGWTWQYGLDPSDAGVAVSNPDADGHTTFEEWIADTDPTDAGSELNVGIVGLEDEVELRFEGSTNRVYTVLSLDRFPAGMGANLEWKAVAGAERVPGTGKEMTLRIGAGAESDFYRLLVEKP